MISCMFSISFTEWMIYEVYVRVSNRWYWQ